jgi:hypothetical protein
MNLAGTCVTGADAVVPHVAPAGAKPGTKDLLLDSTTIDTTRLTVRGTVPTDGVTFDAWPQSGATGIELAVLHVRAFGVSTGAQIRVSGNRPLVIIAAADVVLDGIVDASAHADQPGPGGAPPGMGPGVGGPGQTHPDHSDGGGGGAGFGTAGAPGGEGSATTLGGSKGTEYGEASLAILQGGSGGGSGGPDTCPTPLGGAGGGAVQIFSATTIRVLPRAGINVGGGGGAAAMNCAWYTAASGGGSGGGLFLQAPSVDNQGTLAANGGAGGTPTPESPGEMPRPGEDAHFGDSPATNGGAGGLGGYLTTPPVPGDAGPGNGGGGGGAVGRIRILTRTPFANAGVVSPPAIADGHY